MTVDSDYDLEGQIGEWRAYMHRRRELRDTDAEELEDHLRSRITELTDAGLRADEAFLIAVKRMGSLDELSREFAREHSERLWKQLVLPGEPDRPAARSRHELPVMVLCAAVAALAIKVPAWFGLDIDGEEGVFYARNLSLFALPPLAAYFAWQRQIGLRVIGVLAFLFVLGAVAANTYPLALHLISSGAINVTDIITHRFALEETERALTISRIDRNSLKAMIQTAQYTQGRATA